VIQIANGLGKAGERTTEQEKEGKERVDKFVESQQNSSILIFTVEAVEDDGLGMGSCAAVLVQPYTDKQEVVKMEVFSVLTDSIEAEVCGIGLALNMAIQHYI